MSIHISSNDVDSGTKYNGTWNFSKTLSDTYKLVYQDFTLNDIPWVFPGCNTLYIEDYNDFEQFDTIEFPTMTATDSTSVINWFTTGIATSGWVTVTSGSYVASTNSYIFNFSTDVLIRYTVADSSIAYVFDWVYHDPLSPNPVLALEVSAKYITSSPKLLEIHSPQIQSETNNVNGDNPAMFISTKDNFINNQQISILNPVSALNLQFYRPSNHGAVVPFINDFEMVFARR